MAGQALAAGGTVKTDEEVSPDAGHMDIWFTPHQFGTSGAGDDGAAGSAAGAGARGATLNRWECSVAHGESAFHHEAIPSDTGGP